MKITVVTDKKKISQHSESAIYYVLYYIKKSRVKGLETRSKATHHAGYERTTKASSADKLDSNIGSFIKGKDLL